jgi:hypothetical protein
MIGIATLVSCPKLGQDATVRARSKPPQWDDEADGPEVVTVPLNNRALAPLDPERVRRLRRHLVQSLRAMRTMKRPVESASPLRPEPAGFVRKVARAACALCRGYCCKGGGDHGYLDERVMARVRHAQPDLDARAVMRLYVERVPQEGYAGSCLFHGATGCTLDRTLRSDVCNSYFCSGLEQFARNFEAPGCGVSIVASLDGKTRRSPPIIGAPSA